VKTLTELREWNKAHAKADAMRFGQSRLDISDEMDIVKDKARNDADVAKDNRLSRTQGIDAVLAQHTLDAILTPSGSGANLASRAGYPIIAVPFGMVPNAPNPPLPEGFNAKPAPYGVTFTGAQCSEPKLIALAYAFEQASKKRVPPPDLP
jgi:amidase